MGIFKGFSTQKLVIDRNCFSKKKQTTFPSRIENGNCSIHWRRNKMKIKQSVAMMMTFDYIIDNLYIV